MSGNDIAAQLQYIKKLPLYEVEKPFEIFFELPKDAPDKRTTNLEFEHRQTTINDLRGRTSHLSLDKNGFVFRNLPTGLGLAEAQNRETIEKKYLPEVESFIRSEIANITGVYFFDWRLRSAKPQPGPEVIDMNDLTTWLRPAEVVHVDQSPSGALHRVKLHVKEDADRLLQGRLMILNVWRPLSGPVKDYPLALCDGSTVLQTDLIECDHIRRRFFGATLYPSYNEHHRWYYLSEQDVNDVILFKMFDSRKNVNAKCCPHSSFKHPSYTGHGVYRQSVEVRALVFTSDNSE